MEEHAQRGQLVAPIMARGITDFFTQDQIDRVVNGDNGRLRRRPGLAFRSEDYHAFELGHWLNRTWLFIGRASDIPDAGDAKPVPGHPIFLMRGGDGVIRAFHNACRHRGHRLVTGKCDGLKRLVCPYHKWAYELDGRLARTPNFAGAGVHTIDTLVPEEHGLIEVRSGVWHDWILINIDGTAEPLEDFVKPLAQKLDFVDFSALQHFLTMHSREIPANWKICMENTMEPYHVPYVHATTAAGQPLSDHYMVIDDPVTGSAIDIPGSDYTNQPGSADVDNLDMSARYLCRLPNLFLTSYAPDVIVDTMIVPDTRDPRKSWMEQAWYTTSGRIMTADEIEAWNKLEEAVITEDIAVMTEVQAGAESPAVDDGGVMSPAWESCISGMYQHLIGQLPR